MTDKDARLEKVQDALNGLSVWRLAGMADVSGAPDSDDSPGAAFLRNVRDATLDALRHHMIYAPSNSGEAVDALRDDAPFEIADAAVPIYTHSRMQTLVDLAAYLEDVSDYMDPSRAGDIVDVAGNALYIVAERLVNALLDYVKGLEDEDNDDSEED